MSLLILRLNSAMTLRGFAKLEGFVGGIGDERPVCVDEEDSLLSEFGL